MSNSCKDGASKSNDDDVCDVIGKLTSMNTDNEVGNGVSVMSVCANCGKEGNDVNNTCNKCKQVKYCNAVCKKIHKKKHKKDCEEYVKCVAEHAAKLRDEELKLAAEKHEEDLFKQPPPDDDCPICFQRLPTVTSGWRYYACCGKRVCSGCAHAPVYDNQGNQVDSYKCPFCRTPWPETDEEIVKRYKRRIEVNDAQAIYNLGNYYRVGMRGYPCDYTKALEYWHRAGELGYAEAYGNIGNIYHAGKGVKVDKKKARRYYELAAIGGSEVARCNLGGREEDAGNMKRALKHYMIAVRSGYPDSLERIKGLYTNGHATKDNYMTALQSYQEYLSEIKSTQRDNAAAAREDYRYY